MAADLDAEFAEFKVATTKVRCHTCKLPPDLLAWVNRKLEADSGASRMSVAAFLKTKGYEVSASGLANHWQGRRTHDFRQ